MRDGMTEALDFFKTHPDETSQAIAKYTGLPAAVVATLPQPALAVTLTPKQIQFWIDICKEQKLIKNNPTPADVWVK